MLEKLKRFKLSDKQAIRLILILIFCSMLILNILTPLLADDYSYALTHSHHRLTGIKDIIIYQIEHYKIWGGRTVAHTIAQIFLLFPKWLFNICNSLIYTFVIYMIYFLSKNNKSIERPYLLVGIHFIVYFLAPVFGQNCIWLVGSCNYIWTMAIMLCLIYQYKNNFNKNDSIHRVILIFLLGIIAGWTNENTSFGLLVILSSITIMNKHNKKELKKWHIGGICGNILGFTIMILAPGNYVRKQAFVDNDFILIRWIKRFIECTVGIYKFCFPLLIALIILITIYIYNHKKINNYVYIFILGGIFSVYPMVLSPEFPERSWFGVIIFLTISTITLSYELENISKVFKPIIFDTLIIATLIFMFDYLNLAKDINCLRNVWNDRLEIISNSDKKDIITLYKYNSDNKKNPNYGLADLGDTSDGWPNSDIGFYYNVKIIGKWAD